MQRPGPVHFKDTPVMDFIVTDLHWDVTRNVNVLQPVNDPLVDIDGYYFAHADELCSKQRSNLPFPWLPPSQCSLTLRLSQYLLRWPTALHCQHCHCLQCLMALNTFSRNPNIAYTTRHFILLHKSSIVKL